MPKARQGLDDKDQKILEILEKNGRANVTQIAREIGLERTPCKERIARLERLDYIQGYTIKRKREPANRIIAIEYVMIAIADAGGAFDRTISDVMFEIEEYINNNDLISWAGRSGGEFSFVLRIDERKVGVIAKVLRDIGSIRGVKKTVTVPIVDRIRPK